MGSPTKSSPSCRSSAGTSSTTSDLEGWNQPSRGAHLARGRRPIGGPEGPMDPHERPYRRSLRDVLTSQGVLTTEQADELISSARETHEPLGAVVVEAGYLTAWD